MDIPSFRGFDKFQSFYADFEGRPTDRVIWPIVSNILQQLGVYWDIIYTINNAIPSVVVAVLLIAFGGRLLGFGKHAHHNDTDDLPPYQG